MKTFKFSDLSKASKEFFDEHGWLHLKGVFSRNEIDHLREAAKKLEAENYQGDLLSYPGTSSLVYNERLMSVAKLLLDTKKPLYYGDSNVLIGLKSARGFHKDNADKINGAAPDWQSDYTLLRMGVYTQDHVSHSDCLALRDGSHKTVETEVGKPFCVPTEPGDLIVWNLRTSHSGNSNRLRIMPNFFLHHRWYRFTPEFMFLPAEKERISFFLTYAKERDHHLERYVSYLKTRKYMIDIWRDSHYTKEQLEEAGKFLEVLDLREKAENIPADQINEFHKEPAF